MWGKLRPLLKEFDPVRIENKVEKGTPDVNLSDGTWIELKWIRKKPAREDTLIHIEHYTTEQKTWHIKRQHAGGKVFVLLKIGPEYLLFTGITAAKYLNETTLADLRKVAIKRWLKKLQI